MKKTTIALPIFLLACGGTYAPTDPAPDPQPTPSSDAAPFAPSPEPVIIRDDAGDAGTMVCHVDGDAARDVACSTQGASWVVCPESKCLYPISCTDAIELGQARAGMYCRTDLGEMGIVEQR